MSDILKTPLTYLTGVGAKRADAFARELGLHTYLDLLHFFPYKYIDRSRIYTIRELRPDMPYVQLRGHIRGFQTVGEGRKKRLVAQFHDSTGHIELMWFGSMQWIANNYIPGKEYIIFGKPQYFKGSYSIPHPEVDDVSKQAVVASGLVPQYSLPERIKKMGINSRSLQVLVHNLLRATSGHIYETLPPHLHQQSGLMSYAEAIAYIHFPETQQQLEAARQRLKFEELFYIQLKLQSMKVERETVYKGFVFAQVGELFNRFYHEGLPFDLTNAQKRVLREVRADVRSGKQMNRLIQGDVGSGKTIVALMSMLLALDNGYQACLMAPTEILARQHYEGLSQLLAPFGIEVALLIGSTTKRERNQILPQLSEGKLRILIGTHALLEEGVQFHRLGMAVIDEQHRFGVAQRSRLWTKNEGILPHILIMSATPIPRTLAMTLYGDLDISVIDQLPPGRKPIETRHYHQSQLTEVYRFVREQVNMGHQVYVVYPMIEESDKQDIKALETGFEHYKSIFPLYNITMVHGKMKPKEKDERMQSFISGEAQILLATTVIEVGVNVPNASVMIIEDASRFGLAQLHQLRGRVGRGAEQSYCLLLSSQSLGPEAKRRIEIMVETTDGFLIAEEDMRLRGFGELEGTKQSGKLLSLRIANLARDGALVQYARTMAERVLQDDPRLSKPEHAILAHRLKVLYQEAEDWSSIS